MRAKVYQLALDITIPKIQNRVNMNSSNRTFIDLFSGIGGFHFAFHDIGSNCVFASEIDKHARLTYYNNFKKLSPNIFASPLLFNDDITNIIPENIPDHDILCGGFPCQSFSIAGYRKGFCDKGRGDLIFNVIDIIKAKKPKVIFLENVKNLYNHDSGKTYKYIKNLIEDEGYFVTEKVLNTMHYGNLPQNRERLYIIGFKNKKSFNNFKFPEPKKLSIKTEEIISQKKVDDIFYYNGKPLFDKIKNDVINPHSFYQWRRIYVRENKSGVCPTLTANMGTGGHNVPIIKDKYGIRKITPDECARLQGFPESFSFPSEMNISQRYKQSGNAVSVPVVKEIAKQIILAMEEV